MLGFAGVMSPVGLSPGTEAPWVTLGAIGQSPHDHSASPHGSGQASRAGDAGTAGEGVSPRAELRMRAISSCAVVLGASMR